MGINEDSLRETMAKFLGGGGDPAFLAKIISVYIKKLERVLLLTGTIAAYQIAAWGWAISSWLGELWRG